MTATEETLQDYRCETKWGEIWEEVVALAKESDIPVEPNASSCGDAVVSLQICKTAL